MLAQKMQEEEREERRNTVSLYSYSCIYEICSLYINFKMSKNKYMLTVNILLSKMFVLSVKL